MQKMSEVVDEWAAPIEAGRRPSGAVCAGARPQTTNRASACSVAPKPPPPTTRPPLHLQCIWPHALESAPATTRHSSTTHDTALARPVDNSVSYKLSIGPFVYTPVLFFSLAAPTISSEIQESPKVTLYPDSRHLSMSLSILGARIRNLYDDLVRTVRKAIFSNSFNLVKIEI